jgi:hypothetical protein
MRKICRRRSAKRLNAVYLQRNLPYPGIFKHMTDSPALDPMSNCDRVNDCARPQLPRGEAQFESLRHPGLLQVARERSLHGFKEVAQLPGSIVMKGFLRAHVLVARHAVAG